MNITYTCASEGEERARERREMFGLKKVNRRNQNFTSAFSSFFFFLYFILFDDSSALPLSVLYTLFCLFSWMGVCVCECVREEYACRVCSFLLRFYSINFIYLIFIHTFCFVCVVRKRVACSLLSPSDMLPAALNELILIFRWLDAKALVAATVATDFPKCTPFELNVLAEIE